MTPGSVTHTQSPTMPARVLLVEDNPGDVLLMRKALGKVGVPCVLRVAEDGVAALSVLTEGAYRPDIVLLDLNLPKKDGREVLRCMKGDDILRRIPVLVLSSSCASEDIAECYDLHANGYMVKPGDARSYSEMIQSFSKFWLEHAALPRH